MGKTKALLYCDLLGTKGLFASRSLGTVRRRYNRFAQLIGQSIDEAESQFGSEVRSVELSSDSAIMRFVSPTDALLVGGTLWRNVFVVSEPDGSDAGLSLRGVLVRMGSNRTVRRNLKVPRYPEITHWQQNPDLLRAILYEQSGAKGMRLMVPGTFSSQAHDDEASERLSEVQGLRDHGFEFSQSIEGLTYPDETQDWKDVLWPLTDVSRLPEMRQRAQNRSSVTTSADIKQQQASTIRLVEAAQLAI